MIRRLFASLNYRYCMASAYLAAHRGDALAVADFEARAHEWEARLVHLDINRRFA